jgi:hypothetical protein
MRRLSAITRQFVSYPTTSGDMAPASLRAGGMTIAHLNFRASIALRMTPNRRFRKSNPSVISRLYLIFWRIVGAPQTTE